MTENEITLDSGGKIFRGNKLIGKVNSDGSVKLNHHAYRKHLDEIELLIAGSQIDSEASEHDLGDEISDQPVTPIEYFQMGEGDFYGESNPPVVDWRWEDWSRAAYWKRYGGKGDLLREVYAKHDMIYDRSN